MDVPSTDNVDDHIGRKSFRWKREKKADEEVAHTKKKKKKQKKRSFRRYADGADHWREWMTDAASIAHHNEPN